MTIEIGRKLVDGVWKTSAYTESEGGGGATGATGPAGATGATGATGAGADSPLALAQIATNSDGIVGGYHYVFQEHACVASVDADDPTKYAISANLCASLPFVVSDHTAAKLYMGFAMLGGGDVPEVPAAVQTLAQGWGANPYDKWDFSYSRGGVVCNAGSEAGKAVGFTYTTGPHLLEDMVNVDGTIVWGAQAGTLTATLGADYIGLPAAGAYVAWLTCYVDFFYGF